MTTIAPVPPSTQPVRDFDQHVFAYPRATPFEKFVVGAIPPNGNPGITPPWLEPGKAWPPMPEPEVADEQE